MTAMVSLTRDLQEAMAIAQGHVDKEQCCKLQLYNRCVKGSSITAGDRVPVSNKRERKAQDSRPMGVHCIHCCECECLHSHISDQESCDRARESCTVTC